MKSNPHPSTEHSSRKSVWKDGLALLLLLVFVILVFEYTVAIRRPWFGVLSVDELSYQAISGLMLTAVQYWHQEGPTQLHFGMLLNPPSVEFENLADRLPNLSYPPGAALSFYVWTKLLHRLPTPAELMRFNLMNHFLIGWVLTLTAYTVLRRGGYGRPDAVLLSTTTGAFILLMPASLYWHQNVYVFDQAVILPFALVVLLECLRGATAQWFPEWAVNVLQGVIFFMGTLTEWLFVFIALSFYALRLFTGDLGADVRTFLWRTTCFWLPVTLAPSLFFFQLESFDGWGDFLKTGRHRAGIGQEVVYDHGGPADFTSWFWERHMADAYGWEGVVLIWGALVLSLGALYYLLRRGGGRLDKSAKLVLQLVGITVVPCLLQVYVFRQHSLQHPFSALKFSVPLSLVSFIALPVLIDRVLRGRLFAFAKLHLPGSTRGVGKASGVSLAALLVVLLGALYISANHKSYAEYFPDPITEPAEIAYFVRDNTEYRDIVFSRSFEIPLDAVEMLSYSMKRVYRALTLDDIHRKVRRLDELDRDYTINLLVLKEDQDLSAGMRNLIARGSETRRSGSLRLVKIEPEAFRRLILDSELEPSLASLREEVRKYSLVQGADGTAEESILRSTGETIRIVPGAMDGAVDTVQQEIGRTWFRGWASNGDHREPADRVVVFVDGESTHEEHTKVGRVYIAKAFGAPSLKRSGFRVELLWPVFDSDPPPVVRVFAISPEGVASELRYGLEYYDDSRRLRLGKGARAVRYSLATDPNTLEESIVSSGGEIVRVVASTMDGAVDAVRHREGYTEFSGWASDSAHLAPANQVAVFVNGEADHYGHTEVSRSDLVEGFGSPSMMQAGFDVVLSEPVFEQDQSPMVRVFAISPKAVASELWYRSEYPDGLQKRRLGTSARVIRYSLLQNRDGSEESIASPQGETIRIIPGTMDGAVDTVRQEEGRTRVSGWASDGEHRRPADQVVIFVNGEADHYGHKVVSGSDLVKGFGAPSLLRASFDVILPGLVFEQDRPPIVRVFAISASGIASELPYLSEYLDGSLTLKLGKH